MAWGLTESWDYFLSGKAAMTFTWGDLGALAQETPERGGKSLVKGMTKTAQCPGTMSYYNIAAGADTATDTPNIVGNTTGGSWAPVISKFAKSPEAAYYVCALMATEPKAKTYAARGFDGVDPGRTFDFPPPDGTGDIQDYVKAGWDEQDATDYTNAYFQTFRQSDAIPLPAHPGHLRILVGARHPSLRSNDRTVFTRRCAEGGGLGLRGHHRSVRPRSAARFIQAILRLRIAAKRVVRGRDHRSVRVHLPMESRTRGKAATHVRDNPGRKNYRGIQGSQYRADQSAR